MKGLANIILHKKDKAPIMYWFFNKAISFGLVIQLHIQKSKAYNDSFPPQGYQKSSPFEDGDIQNSTIKAGMVLWLEAVTKVDVSIMEFEMYGYIVQEWRDKRLSGSLKQPMILREINKIWLTDIYCINCRESTLSSSQNPNEMVRIGPKGDVYYSQGVRLAASCPMNLKDFPFDKQYCSVQFASYSYNTSFLEYFWSGPVVLSNPELDQFKVQKVTTVEKMTDYKSGKYSVLLAEFLFVRRMGFYVIQVFLPTAMLVSLSWITFYMNPGDIGDRLTIGITLILTMIFLLGYINTSLPKVSYIKAVDWYLISSLIFIILGVVEGVIAYGLHFKYSKKGNKTKIKHLEKKQRSNSNGSQNVSEENKPEHFLLDRLKEIRQRHNENASKNYPAEPEEYRKIILPDERNADSLSETTDSPYHSKGCFKRCKVIKYYALVDKCSKLLFPLTFTIFNILYFYIYHDSQWNNEK